MILQNEEPERNAKILRKYSKINYIIPCQNLYYKVSDYWRLRKNFFGKPPPLTPPFNPSIEGEHDTCRVHWRSRNRGYHGLVSAST